jgi:hypothetical protein
VGVFAKDPARDLLPRAPEAAEDLGGEYQHLLVVLFFFFWWGWDECGACDGVCGEGYFGVFGALGWWWWWWVLDSVVIARSAGWEWGRR